MFVLHNTDIHIESINRSAMVMSRDMSRVLLGDYSPRFSAMSTLTVLTELLTRPNVNYSTDGNIPQQIPHFLLFV